MDIFLLISSILILTVCLAILIKLSNKIDIATGNMDGIELQITLEKKLDQARALQSESLERQLELSGQTQLRLSQLISEEMQKLSAMQQQIALRQSESQSGQLRAQGEHFGEIKTQNLQTLAQIQQFIQVKLNEGLEQIGKTNQQNFQLLSQTNHEKLSQIQQQVESKMDEQLKKNLESFAEVQKNLVQMQESAGKMVDSTKSIDKLNTIFARTSAKSFGDFGERYLEQFLHDNLMPTTWSRQYLLPAGAGMIDFCITFGENKIGIDCKFPVTKFSDFLDADDTTRDAMRRELHSAIKKMVDEISEKYAKTKHFSYVMMYVPADGIYQEIVNSDVLTRYLATRKITPTSPNTLLPQLLIVDDYNRKLFINENAEQIQKGLKKIARNVESFQNEFRKLGDKLRQAQGNYDDAYKNLDGLRGEVLKLESESEMEQREVQNLV